MAQPRTSSEPQADGHLTHSSATFARTLSFSMHSFWAGLLPHYHHSRHASAAQSFQHALAPLFWPGVATHPVLPFDVIPAGPVFQHTPMPSQAPVVFNTHRRRLRPFSCLKK